MKYKVTIGSFGIITDNKDRVLLCHRTDYDLWNLPGGGLEKGESPWQSVIREVKEEVGFEVGVEELLGVYSKKNKDDIVFSFRCKVVGGKIKLSEEADKIEYFSVDSLPTNTVPKQVERIKDYFSANAKPVLKIQGGLSTKTLINKGLLKKK